MKDKVVSSKEGSRGKTQQIFTPKYVEDIITNVMESNKSTEMFQAMAIVSLNMGNLGLKVESLETKLTMVEGDK
jgi:hypothetical protein